MLDTLLGLHSRGALSYQLLHILGGCQREEGVAALLLLLRSGWTLDRQSLLDALVYGGGKDYGRIEEWVKDLDGPREGQLKFFVPSKLTILRTDVGHALIETFEGDGAYWEWRDRRSLIAALGQVLCKRKAGVSD